MKKLLIIIVAVCFSTTAFAQGNIWKLSWDMNQGLGNTNQYINQFSVRGISADAAWFLNDHWGIGGTISWGLFYKDFPKETIEINNSVSLTGKQVRYNNFVPIMLTGGYYFGNSGGVRPYLELGLGTIWSERITDIGLYEVVSKDWMFGMAPAAGVVIPISKNFCANAKLKYNVGFAKEGHNLSAFGLSIGFAWTSYKL